MDMPLQMSAFLASLAVTQRKIHKAVDSLGISPAPNADSVDRRAAKVAAVQYEMKTYRDLKDFVYDVDSYVADAVKKGARLVVFPEGMGFASLSLVPMYASVRNRLKGGQEDRAEALEAVSDALIDYFYEVYSTLFSDLAKAHRVYIAAGSIYLYEEGSLRNRAFLYGPLGEELSWQDEIFPSRDELDMGVQGGDEVYVARTSLGGIAMLVGRDDEYYEPFKIAALSGADMVAFSAAYRGRPDKFRTIGAIAARAYECGIYCVRSAMVGRYVTGEKLNDHAGIYGPYACADGEHGVISEAPEDGKGHVITAVLDYMRLEGAMDGYNSDSNEAIARDYGGIFNPDAVIYPAQDEEQYLPEK